MQLKVRFICCRPYNFVDDAGNQVHGVSCSCFDEASNKIIKVKVDRVLDYVFGDEIMVNVVFNGNYVRYEAA